MPRDKTPGFLHSSVIAEQPWDHVTMDFHLLPQDKHGFDNVFVIVDILGKRHFSLPCKRIINAKGAVLLYYRYIYRQYGCPLSITCDRGPQFILQFIDELYRVTQIKLKLSMVYYPQTNGQTEIVNQIINQQLRPFINYY